MSPDGETERVSVTWSLKTLQNAPSVIIGPKYDKSPIRNNILTPWRNKGPVITKCKHNSLILCKLQKLGLY